MLVSGVGAAQLGQADDGDDRRRDPEAYLGEAEPRRLLGDGQSLSNIAEALGVSYKTVANTCSQIKAKLGVARTADLVRLSIERGVA